MTNYVDVDRDTPAKRLAREIAAKDAALQLLDKPEHQPARRILHQELQRLLAQQRTLLIQARIR
jgi:hypothetical protein